ncbi:hypothetical protein BpHYR1_047167 [Brachionus plicatilis]|uniref:RING-type E3 ubiquitin transferase n=1 Tax=Brachionus plicatilis TaxID=10195 RepID=A0A3M7S1S5_BRAPC|nr:hypothetical protein BpHYR1_047167 [Brachionus plicatilis]
MEWKDDPIDDFEPGNLDLDKLSLNECSMNADLVKQIILSSHSACIKPDTSSESENTIQLNEDDLIDRTESLRAIFQDFKDKNECIVDQSQGLFGTKNSKLSKSIQRKLINLNQYLAQGMSESTPGDLLDLVSATVTTNQTNKLINQSLNNQEFKKKIFRLLRSIVERVLIDALSLYDQYINQIQQQELIFSHSTSLNSTTSSTMSNTNLNNPTSKLWIEIRNRGCQFLGPQMQEDVLRLTLHALETVNRMSRKILVLYVVHMLKKHYPKASKTSVGHVIQLLYRAGCFKVEKRDNDSSLMELRKEFLKYPALRRQHDMQIIQIALESGIRMSPEQWSQKLFGDSTHKSEMQSIIDKLQSQQTIEKLIQDFFEKIQNGSQSSFGHQLEPHLNSLFMGAFADFSYFASINFEKKILALQEKYKTKRSSMSLAESASNIGSGGESMISEEDSDDFNFNDLCDFEPNDSFVELKQTPQTKIVWSLLIDCLKRMTKILTIHLEYSSRLMSIIMSNQAKNQAIGKPMVASVRSQNEPYQYSPKTNVSINISGVMLNPMTSGQGFLMSMGPSAKPKPKFNQPKSKTKNFHMPSGDFRSNSFNYSNSELGLGLASKIWSDETVSMGSNSSDGFNKKRLDFNTRSNFNYQDANFDDSNIFQSNFFDSDLLLNAFQQSEQQSFSKVNSFNQNF